MEMGEQTRIDDDSVAIFGTWKVVFVNVYLCLCDFIFTSTRLETET